MTSATRALHRALELASYEILPLRGAEDAVIGTVPLKVPVSVTMSAAKGLEATISLVERLAEEGYTTTPHLAARMICDAAQLDEVIERLRTCSVRSVFVVAGDTTAGPGGYPDSLALLEELHTRNHPFRTIGIGGYPEGHPGLGDQAVSRALRRKAPYGTHVLTQTCFRGAATATWALRIHAEGVRLPVRVGLPGAVTRARLARVSASIGLGPSARFVRKQNQLLWRFALPGGFQPDRIVRGLAPASGGADHRISGLHFFTFNEVARTEAWRQRWIARLESLPAGPAAQEAGTPAARVPRTSGEWLTW